MNEQYVKKMRDDITDHYMKSYAQKWQHDSWSLECQKILRDFVLLRTGWKRDEKSEGTFIFDGVHPITINILNTNDPGVLLVDTAVAIAKAELINGLAQDSAITASVQSQDWTIPFVRIII